MLLTALAFLVGFLPFALYRSCRAVVFPLRTSKPHVDLTFSPNKLTIRDVVVVIILLIARSIGQVVRQDRYKSAIVNNESKGSSSQDTSAPALTLTMPLEMGEDDVQLYTKAVADKADISTVPGHMLLAMSAIIEPAMLLLLGKKGCPVLPLGAVNVRNRFELSCPRECRKALAGELKTLAVKAALRPEVHKVKRGFEYDLTLEVVSIDPKSNRLSSIYRQTFTLLQFVKHHLTTEEVDPVSRPPSDIGVKHQTPSTTDTTVHIASNEPRLWAALCKDYNPIHISAFAAKLYGFPRKIAHGNHAVAKAIDALSEMTNGPLQHMWYGQHDRPIWLEVAFKRPMQVPADLSIALREDQSPDIVAFDIVRGGKVHVEARAGFM